MTTRNINAFSGGKNFLALLIVELTLYVTPCAMEMPRLLAALLQQQQSQYDDITDTMLPLPLPPPPPPLPMHQHQINEAIESAKFSTDTLAIPVPVLPSTVELPHNNADNGAAAAAGDYAATVTGAPSMVAIPTPRRCSIEITSKVAGSCQQITSVGSACVSGEYVDLFSYECT